MPKKNPPAKQHLPSTASRTVHYPEPLRFGEDMPLPLVGKKMLAANPNRIERAEAERERLELQLAKERAEYKKWVAIFGSVEKMEAYLADIQKRGEAIKAKLSDIPHYPLISGMDEREALIEIVKILAWVDGNLNTGKGLTDDMMLTIAEAIRTDYRYLRIEDISYALRRAVLQAKGPTMRLDTQVVMAWLKKYDDERTEQKAVAAQNRHYGNKANGL